MKKSLFVFVGAFLFLAAGSAFAGGTHESHAAAALTTAKTQIVLAVGPRGFGNAAPYLIQGFMKTHPNIDVKWLKISDVPNVSLSFYVTNFSAGNPTPDVAATDIILTGDFAQHGWIAPVNPYFTAQQIAKYNPDFIRAATVKGKVYGVPLYEDGTHLFYRTDLLKKYGFQPPKTWEELVQEAQAITAGEHNPELVGYTSMWAKIEGLFMDWLSFFYGDGGTFFTANGKVNVDSPQGLKAMQTMYDFIYKYKIANNGILTSRPNDAEILFREKRAVFMVVQDFVWPPLTASDSPVRNDVNFTRVPYFAGHPTAHSTAIGGFILSINAHSKHKAAAAELIRYFTDYQSQLHSALTADRGPTLPGVYNDALLKQQNPVLAKLGADYAVGVFRPSARTGTQYPQVSEIMQEQISAALNRVETPAQAMKTAQQQITALLQN